jgi:hypothetical protein
VDRDLAGRLVLRVRACEWLVGVVAGRRVLGGGCDSAIRPVLLSCERQVDRTCGVVSILMF